MSSEVESDFCIAVGQCAFRQRLQNSCRMATDKQDDRSVAGNMAETRVIHAASFILDDGQAVSLATGIQIH